MISNPQNGLSIENITNNDSSIRLVDKSDNLGTIDVPINEAKKPEPIPIGAIVMFKGNLDDLPNDWKLCDGSTGTPNLLGMFVCGKASADLSKVITGGHLETQIPKHDHGAHATKKAGEHTHTCQFEKTDKNSTHTAKHDHDKSPKSPEDSVRIQSHQDKGHKYAYGNWKRETGKGGEHTHEVKIPTKPTKEQNPVNHTHQVTVTSSGAGHYESNLPPYYELAYIIKVK